MLDGLGLEVHHIIVNHGFDYEFAGKLFNLGNIAEHSLFPRKIAKAIALKNYLNENQIEIIIDHRTRHGIFRELIYKFVYGKRQVFSVVHSANLTNYFSKTILFAKYLNRNISKFICVSKTIETKLKSVYGFENVVVIQNPFPVFSEIVIMVELPEKYILYYGRLDNRVKNFELMLSSFAKSNLPNSGYQLLILGDGPDGDRIIEFAKSFQIESNVKILPFVNNPRQYIENARFTVLTSRYEGFPMSIIESLSLGISVVSVDCESGPSEVIVNEINGLLVPNHNPELLAEAFDKLAFDNDLHHICISNAAESVSHLSLEKVAKQWKDILEI